MINFVPICLINRTLQRQMKHNLHITVNDFLGLDIPFTYNDKDILVSTNITPYVCSDKRSREPVRLGELRVAMMKSGKGSATVNAAPHCFEEGMMVLDGSGTLYENAEIVDDSIVPCVSISHSMIYNALRGDIPAELSRTSFSQTVVLTQKEQDVFCAMVETMKEYASNFPLPSRTFYDMVAAFLRFISELLVRSGEVKKNGICQSRMEGVYRQFVALVAKEGGHRRTLSYYAAQLCVSTHYLSIAVSTTGGISAKQFVDRSVVDEIKVLLRHSELSVSQIAEQLEFPNDSFMCKFFRRNTGMSPLVYRKQ